MNKKCMNKEHMNEEYINQSSIDWPLFINPHHAASRFLFEPKALIFFSLNWYRLATAYHWDCATCNQVPAESFFAAVMWSLLYPLPNLVSKIIKKHVIEIK